MDHLCGAGEPASNCIQRLCTYALVSFSERVYIQILKKKQTVEESSSKQKKFYKDIKRAHFKIL